MSHLASPRIMWYLGRPGESVSDCCVHTTEASPSLPSPRGHCGRHGCWCKSIINHKGFLGTRRHASNFLRSHLTLPSPEGRHKTRSMDEEAETGRNTSEDPALADYEGLACDHLISYYLIFISQLSERLLTSVCSTVYFPWLQIMASLLMHVLLVTNLVTLSPHASSKYIYTVPSSGQPSHHP